MIAIMMDVIIDKDSKEERLMFTEDCGTIFVTVGKKELFRTDTENMLEICRELLDTFTKAKE